MQALGGQLDWLVGEMQFPLQSHPPDSPILFCQADGFLVDYLSWKFGVCLSIFKLRPVEQAVACGIFYFVWESKTFQMRQWKIV